MHYYQHNIGDFAVLCRGMSYEQIGILITLVDQYAATEAPITEAWVALAFPGPSKSQALALLGAHFAKRGYGWVLPSIEKKLDEYRETSEKRRAAGRKGGLAKAAKPAESEACDTSKQVPSKCLASAYKPITNKPITNKEDIAHASRAASLPCPTDVEPEAWDASNRIRRSKRVGAWTERAWILAVKAGEQKGLSPSEMLDYCISRGWASFRAEYFDERPHAETPEEFGKRIAREMREEEMRRNHASL